MRSNGSRVVLLAALALGGCSSAWWNDPPATAAPPADTLPPAPAGTPYPADTGGQYPQSDWSSPGGTSYAPPGATVTPPPRTRPAPTPDVPPDYAPPPQMPPVRYDNVGYAVWSNEPGTVAAAHPSLPPGSFAEVTALDTGKTILVPITARSRPGREIELSGAAAQELGMGTGGQGAVRVRAANATGGDIAALKAGRPAPARPDTPPVLLNALRRKVAGTLGQIDRPPGMPPRQTVQLPVEPPIAAPPPRRPIATPVPTAPKRPVARPAAAGPGYYVQVAALADAARAQALAREIGGTVNSGGGLHRVRFGPFDDLRTAQAARDDVAARGYGEARIVRQD